MGVRERSPTLCQRINVWRLHLWVTTEVADPVILVINSKEEDIALIRSKHLRRGEVADQSEDGQRDSATSHAKGNESLPTKFATYFPASLATIAGLFWIEAFLD